MLENPKDVISKLLELSELGKVAGYEMNTQGLRGGPVAKTLPSCARAAALIPGEGVKIPHASRRKTQIIKQKPYCNKFKKHLT